jgi:murein L,D-transpeptidase YcbB/YkuD
MQLFPLRAACVALVLLFALPASGQVPPGADATTTTVVAPPPVALSPLAEAIRERVDRLRYASAEDGTDQVIRGQRIILADIVARYFESQQFQPKWRDPARLDLLVAALADLVDDGLDPADYHIEALHSFRTDLRNTSELAPAEQADLEVLAIDAMMLGLYHLYLGKVDPAQLSSQWNFTTRPVSVERGFERLTAALDSGQIREAFDRARPQHDLSCNRGRRRLVADQRRADHEAGAR